MYNRIPLLDGPTPLEPLSRISRERSNNFYIKRDDKAGPEPGGNKARKLEFILGEIKKQGYDHVVTCGSVFSNHCRLTAMAANLHGLDCTLVLNRADDDSSSEVESRGNFFLYQLQDVDIELIDRPEREEEMQNQLEKLRSEGKKPYLIEAGGNEPAGVHGYVEAAAEIKKQCHLPKNVFDFIFLATGTGTTQAGLIIGNHISRCAESVIGISVEAEKGEGRKSIAQAVDEYCALHDLPSQRIKDDIYFVDDYVGEGYGVIEKPVVSMLEYAARKESLLLDPVYTAKAFRGMLDFLEEKAIKNRNVLFLHSGGLPILFSRSDLMEKYMTGEAR